MAGYDPFVELLDGEPIYSDGVAVTSEGVFPLIVATGVTQLSGQIEAGTEVDGAFTQTHALTAQIEAAAEVDGSLLARFAGQIEAGVEVEGSLTQTHILNGQVEAAAELFGTLTVTAALTELVGQIEAASEVNGSTLTVQSAAFVGWGIPMGV